MADYTIVEEALKRGYTMDEIADNLARDSGVDPADARGRGYPHPTQAGMWAIGSQDEAKAATVPATSATQNDAPPRQSASWVIRNKETGEVVMETFDRKKVDALNTAKYEAVPIREYLEGLNNRNESTAAEPPAVEVRAPVQRKRPASNNIAQAIINMGGVSTSLKNDILGDAATRTRPGLFTSNGTTDLGALAARLSGEFGFSQIDTNDATDNSGAKQLADLIARAVNGESILNEEAMIRAQEAEEVARHQDAINRKAEELGIKPSGRGRPFSKVEAEVLKLSKQRLEKEIASAGEEMQAAREFALKHFTQEEIDAISDKAVDQLGSDASILETYKAISNAVSEAINEDKGSNRDSATDAEAEGTDLEGGRNGLPGAEDRRAAGEGEGAAREGQGAEVAPEFGLVGQTEAEARAEQGRLNQPEGLTKEQIDREATAPFSLHSDVMPPSEGPSGETYSMFTPDGPATVAAEANRQAELSKGDRFKDAAGNEWEVWASRHGSVEAHPVINGKPQVNRDTSTMFAVDDGAKERHPDRRQDVFPVGHASDPVAAVKATLDAAGVTGTDRTSTIAAVRRGDLTPEDVAEAHPVEIARKPLNADAEAIAKADADLESALGDLGDIIGQNFRMNFTPEQEQKIIPVLTRLFDAAFRKGYYTFKDAARFVLDTIKAKFGGDIEEQITLDHLQGAYIGMAGRYRDQGADSARVVVAVENKKELEVVHGNDQHRGSNLERDSQDANTSDGMGEEGVRNERGGNRGGRGSGIQDSQGEGGSRGGVSVSGREAVSSGERGDLEIYTGAPGVPASTAGNGVSVGSDSDSFNGSPIESDSASVIEEVAESGLSVEKAKLTQLQADKKEHSPGLNNIRETLPILTEGQQEDVYIAETRFAKPDGYGMLFTNGTGTGKTFTGLGVIKRFVTNGKDNIIVVVPNDKILSDWQKSGKLLGLNLSQLANTQSAGSGVVITTYANFGQNNQLAHRNWDLIVHDEAHYLKMDAKGSDTLALKALQAISLHPDGAHVRHSMLYTDDIAKMADIQARLKDNIERGKSTSTTASEMAAIDVENDRLVDALNAARKRHTETVQAVRDDVAARQGEARPRALFLSATPFAYEKAVDWANGFLFDYNEGRGDDQNGSRGYNAGNNREQFFLQHFGYRMRFGKLTQPDAKVDSGLMQRQFNSWLKKSGSLSGRMLDVKADYDRRFILVESAIGHRIDAALQWFSEQSTNGNKNPGLRYLRDTITDNFSYLQKRYLLEAIKAKEVIPHVKEHLALGRKVVVFHDYKKGGGFNPFNVIHKSGEGADEYNAAVDMFRDEFKDLIASPVWQSSSPIATFQREFPGVLLFNGDVPAKQRRANVEKFQDDDSGPQVILVQSAAGKEGISLHDTTGKHQRVLFNLGQPTQPTTAIQQEGRIYRTGQKSDAIFRYLNTGTNWERWTFATTIAQRASAAENLGMGEQARALKDAFIAGFEESDDYRAGMEGEGKGGKERDKAANNALTEYDRAKAFYFGTQKKNSKTKAQEGADYFATPEPVGLKMMELADIRPGESVLEPSAGHGAIARWAPDTAEKTAIEPSMTLRPRLAMVFDGKILGQTFEDLHVSNKYDAIVMNPPFGSGGRTAIDHLAKAATHLRDGGRIVALIPRGPAADAKFDKWMYETQEKPSKPMVTHPELGAIYKGDTVKTNASFMPEGIVSGVDASGGRPVLMVKKPGTNSSSMIPYEAIKSIEPTGKRTESFRPSKGINLVANIELPKVTFERAGTKVATRIVVLEKNENAPQQTNRDYSNVTDIGDLFDRMENLSIPGRAKPVEAERNVAVTGGRKSVIEKANADAKAAEEKAQEAGAIAADASEATFTLSGDKIVTNAPATEYTTKAGKKLDGVLVPDEKMAKAVDQFTWKIRGEGKWFVRLRHIERPGVAMFSRGRGNLRSRPRGEITHETQRLEKEINRDLSRQGKEAIWATGFITRSAVPDNARRLVAAVEKLFGVRVEFVQVGDERANIFNGVFLGGNTLFVNVDSSSPVSTVIGHEFLHFLKESNPDLYAKAESDLLALANAKKFAAAATKHQPAMNAGEEVIADTFGDQFSNPEFWEEMANRVEPSLFMRIRAAFTRFMGKLLGEIKAMGTTHKTDALYSDLDAVRDAVLSATVGAAKGRKLATPSWSNLHARFMTAFKGGDVIPNDERIVNSRIFDSADVKITAKESRRASNDLDFTQPKGQEPLRKTSFGYANDTYNLFHATTINSSEGDIHVFHAHDPVTGELIGSLGLGLNGDEITVLYNIKDETNSGGFGEKILRSLLAGSKDGLYIVNMLPDAVGFWKKVGVSLDDHLNGAWEHGNGILTEQALTTARGEQSGARESKARYEQAFSGGGGSEKGGETNKTIPSGRVTNETTPANAGVSVSAPSESVRRIQAVVERFKSQFKGTSALDIRVVSTTFDIPARFRPSPFAEGVFHDDAGLVYLVTMNLRNPRGELSENRAWQVLLHESVGHYGLSQMMGDKFAGILKAVKQATLAGRKVLASPGSTVFLALASAESRQRFRCGHGFIVRHHSLPLSVSVPASVPGHVAYLDHPRPVRSLRSAGVGHGSAHSSGSPQSRHASPLGIAGLSGSRSGRRCAGHRGRDQALAVPPPLAR